MTLGDAGVQDGGDVRMDQPSGGGRRRHEPLAKGAVVSVTVRQHLDGDRTLEQDVLGTVGQPQAALAEDRAELVPPLQATVAERRLSGRNWIVHAGTAPGTRGSAG